MSSLRICKLIFRNAKSNRIQTCASILCGHRKAYHCMVASVQPGFSRFTEKLPSSCSISTSSTWLGKGKDKGGDKKKGKGGKQIFINEALLSQLTNLEKLKEDLEECVDKMKEDFIKNLSLRSATGAIESLPVKVDGDDYQIQDLAQINRKNPKSIVMNMSSFPQAIPAVLEALQKSGMDLNPQQDGTKIFIPVPKVTKEHRENLSKNAKALFIKYRDRIKDVQNKYHKKIRNKESEGGVSEDQVYEALDMVTHMAQAQITKAEQMLAAKQNELTNTS